MPSEHDFDLRERDDDFSPGRSPPSEGVRQRPCPMCGGVIVIKAHGCPYCGEVFEHSDSRSGGIDASFVRRFRRQVHGLGGYWILIAIVAVGSAASLLSSNGLLQREIVNEAKFRVLLIVGIAFLAVGILTCVKNVPAIYTGLVLTYLGLAGTGLVVLARGDGGLICGSIFWIVANIFVLVQAHRVIGWAHQLRGAGLEPTAHPDDVA